jgi:hypothetical protein
MLQLLPGRDFLLKLCGDLSIPKWASYIFAKTSLFFTQYLNFMTGQVWCTRIYLEKYIHLSAQAEKTRSCIVGYNSLSCS